MSAVTASIIVGSRHRSDPGVQPRWLAVLHEGRSYAWHLLKLHLSGQVVTNDPDDPPGVLWKASADEDVTGDLSLLLHLHATRTPAVVNALQRCESIRKRRVDLAALQGHELAAVEHARSIASAQGRELMLSTTILLGSRLTEEALLALPDWELGINHTALVREWNPVDSTLVTTDYRIEPEPDDAFGSGADDEDLDGPWDADWGDSPRDGVSGTRHDAAGEASSPDAGTSTETRRPSERTSPADLDEPTHRRLIPRRDRKTPDPERPRIGLADLFGRDH